MQDQVAPKHSRSTRTWTITERTTDDGVVVRKDVPHDEAVAFLTEAVYGIPLRRPARPSAVADAPAAAVRPDAPAALAA